jgi:hypothetical protein
VCVIFLQPFREGPVRQALILSEGEQLSVPAFFNTIEQTTFSTWIRESPSLFAFYFILLFHTIGLSMVVGANTIVDLRLLGVAPGLPLKPLKRLFRVMWTGLGINIFTGLMLLFAYPTKALTNPVFYAKLTLITLAVITMYRISVRVFDNPSFSESDMMATGKKMAIVSLVLWASAITAGRLLSETYTYLTYHAYLLGITRS